MFVVAIDLWPAVDISATGLAPVAAMFVSDRTSVVVAIAAFVVSLVALAISAYNALAARAERRQAKRADRHVGASTVSQDGDDYVVKLRVTNAGRAIAPYVMVSIVTREGQRLSAPVRSEKGLPPDRDVWLTLRLQRASVPPKTPIVHALLAWDDPSGYDHLKVSGHRVRLDLAKERPSQDRLPRVQRTQRADFEIVGGRPHPRAARRPIPSRSSRSGRSRDS